MVAVTASAFHHQQQQYMEEGFDGFIDKPVRGERVYACLAELLGVEYTYAPPETGGNEAEIDTLRLSRDLHEGLEAAVKMHSITHLNQLIEALEEQGTDGQRLATRLRDLAQQYNMRAIESLLNEVEVV